MIGLQVIVAVGIAVLVGTVAARRLRVPSSIILVALGLGLSLIAPLRTVGLPPELVLLIFLPALLFWESLTTSSREILRFLRGVVLSATVLVVVTAAAVAWVAHALGLPWESAWIIGAAVAPTDATAVAALGRVLPRGGMTILRAESLINDGTALVVYALALEFSLSHDPFSVGHASWLLVRSFAGGIVTGAAVGVAMFAVRRRLRDPVAGSLANVLTPFVAYLLAEELHSSGVLAVVICGLYMAHKAPGVIPAHTRQQTTGFWTLVTFLLNGALFVLIGLQFTTAVGGLSDAQVGRGILVTAAVFATVILVRFGFLHLTIGLIRAVDRRPRQRLLRTTFRGRVVSTAAGLRGGVSLAVALSTPAALSIDGTRVRDMVVFVTAGVVVTSLVLQGLALPAIIRWARLPPDTAFEGELDLAVTTLLDEAQAALDDMAARLGVSDAVRDEVADDLEARRAAWDDADVEDAEAPAHLRQRTALMLEVVALQRAALVRLRNERAIDDTVLRRVQSKLDVEEVRLRGPAAVE